jgi:hypothetical protein
MFPHNQTKLYDIFQTDLLKIYPTKLANLNRLAHHSFEIPECANALHGVFFCTLASLNANVPPATPMLFFTDLITTARELNQIEAAQYYVSLLRKCEPVPQFGDFEVIQILYRDNPNHTVAFSRRTCNCSSYNPD